MRLKWKRGWMIYRPSKGELAMGSHSGELNNLLSFVPTTMSGTCPFTRGRE
jgi:hypothetical protein